MNSGRALRYARDRAGLTQRQVAERAGVPQPSVARIESGAVVPRVDTLTRLLRACGFSLEALPRLGDGVDRTVMRRLAAAPPAERAEHAAAAGRNLAEVLTRVR